MCVCICPLGLSRRACCGNHASLQPLSLTRVLVVQEEFLEPLKYIASIRERAEPYGVCKIVPPAGWDPSWPIDPKTFEFATRVQNVPRTPPPTAAYHRRRRTFAARAGRAVAPVGGAFSA
jgi:hypothetical protein